VIDIIKQNLPSNTKWFDLIETSSETMPLQFKNNKFYSIKQKQNHGFGLRINIDDKIGFSYTNNMNSLDQTLSKAIALSKFGEKETFTLIKDDCNYFEPYSEKIKDINLESEVVNIEKIISEITTVFPTALVNFSIGTSFGYERIVNSLGFDNSFRNSYFSASLSVSDVINGEEKISLWDGVSSIYQVEYKQLQNKIIKMLTLAQEKKELQSGRVPVIFTPKAFANLISILLSGLNGKSVYKGVSPFEKKMHEKIFSENFTVMDDPLLKDSPHSFPFDDEGVVAKRKSLINRGVVENFIVDLKYANKLSINPTGNGTRGYAGLPYPSFSNIVIAQGNFSSDELINDISEGILVDQFIGLGQSNTLTGDFSANLDLAYFIKNGKILGRIKDSMISDNIFRLLSHSVEFSNNRESVGSILSPYVFCKDVAFTH